MPDTATPTHGVVFAPAGAGPHAAVVLGQDGTGLSTMNRQVASSLAERGYLVVAPDYYRGAGPADPDSLDEIDDLMRHIGGIDWKTSTTQLAATYDWVSARDDVHGDRIATWGWCTGATFALRLAADRPVACAVAYYPSQPQLAPVELVTCPTLLIAGTDDPVLGRDVLDGLCARGNDLTLETFEGAGHAFCSTVPGWHHEVANRCAWQLAVAFLDGHLA